MKEKIHPLYIRYPKKGETFFDHQRRTGEEKVSDENIKKEADEAGTLVDPKDKNPPHANKEE